jgi:hypothetical protein
MQTAHRGDRTRQATGAAAVRNVSHNPWMARRSEVGGNHRSASQHNIEGLVMANALEEAIEIGKHKDRPHDVATLKRVLAQLVQLVITERKDHARELRDVAQQRESA